MQKYAVYWPEGGAASQYSVFIGQKVSFTSQSNGADNMQQCDMHEDTNFNVSNASGTSVSLFCDYTELTICYIDIVD